MDPPPLPPLLRTPALSLLCCGPQDQPPWSRSQDTAGRVGVRSTHSTTGPAEGPSRKLGPVTTDTEALCAIGAILQGRADSGARSASPLHGKVLTIAEVVLPVDKVFGHRALRACLFG